MIYLTRNDYNEFSKKSSWHKTTVSLIKEHYNLQHLKHTEICDILISLGIELDKRDSAYYTRHKNSKWVSVWKSKISQARKDEWAALSKEEFDYRGKKYVQNLLNFRNNISADENKRIGQLISSAKIEKRNSMTPVQLKARYERMSAGWLKNGLEKKLERIAKIKHACWDSLTDEERSEKCIKTSKHLKSKYSYRNAQGIQFESSWEELVFNALKSYGISFRYTNNDNEKNILKLNHPLKRTWKPDFILDELKMIIEVKGFPRAYKKFLERDLPAFIASEYSKLYSVYLIDFPLNATFTTFESLIAKAILCHSIE